MKEKIKNFFIKWGKRIRLFYICATLLTIIAIFVFSYTRVGLYFYELQAEATPFAKLPLKVDAVVILGGDSVRASDAVKLYNSGKTNKIIVSADVQAMMDVLSGAKIPEEIIYKDNKSSRTFDHPREILKIKDVGINRDSKIIITTSATQTARAIRIFKNAGYDNVFAYSQDSEIRLKEFEKKGYIGIMSFPTLCYGYLAWIKYFFVDCL